MSLDRIHPHAQYHVFDTADQLPPATDILRLYVDAATGNDSGAGTSWATAWLTLSKLCRAVASILFLEPNGVKIYAHVRGGFAGRSDALALMALAAGDSQVFVGCDFADSTVTATGLVAAIGVGPEAASLIRVQLSWVPSNADYGRYIRFNDGGANAATYQIVKVDTAAQYVWLSTESVPLWCGVGANVDIFDPGAIFSSAIRLSAIKPQERTASSTTSPSAVIWNVTTASGLNARDASGVMLAVRCFNSFFNSAMPAMIVGGSQIQGADSTFLTQADGEEYGLWAGAPTGRFGIRCSSFDCYATNSYPIIAGSSISSLYGNGITMYCSASPAFHSYGEADTLLRCFAGYSFFGTGITLQSGFLTLNHVTVSGLPASGYTGGLLSAWSGKMDVYGTEAVNAGTGAGLYGAWAQANSVIRIMDSASEAAIQGYTNSYRATEGGLIIHGFSLSIGARHGDGADMYVGQLGRMHFVNNVTKSATNVSGGGIAAPVLEVADGGEVTQVSGASFVIANPAVDWNTDYGTTGAISVHENGEARLRALSGGIAGVTTGTACTIKNASKLIHGSAGLLGITPLDLGGLPAPVAWPAAAQNDQGAVVPQNCILIPNVA